MESKIIQNLREGEMTLLVKEEEEEKRKKKKIISFH